MGVRSWLISQRFHAFSSFAIASLFFLCPVLGFADVEGSLQNIRNELTGMILPLLSVIGLGIASVSFFTGNPNAKQHIIYAILGSCFGFGAQQIVNWIASMVR